MRHHLAVRRLLTAGASLVLAAAALTSFSQGASADDSGRGATRAALESTVSPQQVDALRDTFGYTADQVLDRLTTESLAMRAQPQVAYTLGRDYGGLWLGTGTRDVYVAVTNAARFNDVRGYGYTPVLVKHTAKQLTGLQEKLNATGASPSGVTGWYADVKTNSLVVLAHPDAAAKARTWAKSAGVPGDALRVETTNETPRTYADIVGGTAYYINNSSRCSVGFAVVHPSRGDGFVSAGHCGSVGASVTSGTGAPGTFINSVFPGSDYSYIDAGAGWVATPNVQSSSQQVANANVAPVGSSVCRSGSTTGWHCGSVQQLNTSVTYQEGTVYGVTQTNVCAEPGDSGGSFISGASAQGMTSGGSGNCTSGGTTYFFPVGPALSASGAALKTTGSGPGPGPGPGGCDNTRETFNGSLSGTGQQQYQPNGTYYQSTVSGAHIGCLNGPSGTDYDLYLQKWNGSAWATVATSDSSSSQESITYNGTAGYYVWRIYSYSGAGAYTFGMTRP